MVEEQFIIQHSVPSTNERWIHYVAFTRQSGTMYSFFDGVLLDSRSATGDNGDNAGIWNIGRYYYNLMVDIIIKDIFRILVFIKE